MGRHLSASSDTTARSDILQVQPLVSTNLSPPDFHPSLEPHGSSTQFAAFSHDITFPSFLRLPAFADPSQTRSLRFSLILISSTHGNIDEGRVQAVMVEVSYYYCFLNLVTSTDNSSLIRSKRFLPCIYLGPPKSPS